MATQAETLLAEVNAAISAIITGGQAYNIKNRMLQRASLKELRELRNELMIEVEREKSGGVVCKRAVPYR